MNILERLWFVQRGGMIREFEGLTTYFAPRDPDLYRSLLPRPYSMPAQPVVVVFAAEYQRVYWYGTTTSYREWSVMLRSEWRGEEGWYVLTMPVTTRTSARPGRTLGFPKYVVDEIALSRSGDVRTAVARHKGAVQLELAYRPGIARPLTEWEQAFAASPAFFPGDCYLLVPPLRGPRAQKVVLRHVVAPHWAPEPGMLRVRIDPAQPWAGLVPDESEFPGSYNHFVGGANLIPVRLD